MKKEAYYSMFPPNFQSNLFATNYHGLYFELGSKLPNIGEPNLAADNIWQPSTLAGQSFTVGNRVKDARSLSSNPAPVQIRYYYSGNPQNPSNPKYPQIQTPNSKFLIQNINFSNNCSSPPPYNKTDLITGATQINLLIFPNPVTDNLKFELENFTEEVVKYSIYNVHGSAVLSDKTTQSVGNINVATLSPGIYILVFETGERKLTARFAKL